jgi:hypothetical protein
MIKPDVVNLEEIRRLTNHFNLPYYEIWPVDVSDAWRELETVIHEMLTKIDL